MSVALTRMVVAADPPWGPPRVKVTPLRWTLLLQLTGVLETSCLNKNRTLLKLHKFIVCLKITIL